MDFRYPVSTNTAVAPTTSSTPVLAANPDRCYAIIINNHATVTAFLSKSVTASLATGIPIFPAGGFYEITALNLYTGALTAITASGTGDLRVEQS